LPGWLKAVELTLLILVVMVWVLVGFQTRFVYGLLLTLVWLAINIPVNIFLDGRYGLLKPVPAKGTDELTSPPPPPSAS
jgi:hypothetical protein